MVGYLPDEHFGSIRGHYHDILNDIGKEAVLACILNRIEARLDLAGRPQ
jgi:hypothetical protein